MKPACAHLLDSGEDGQGCPPRDPDKVLVGTCRGASLRRPCVLREECHRLCAVWAGLAHLGASAPSVCQAAVSAELPAAAFSPGSR